MAIVILFLVVSVTLFFSIVGIALLHALIGGVPPETHSLETYSQSQLFFTRGEGI